MKMISWKAVSNKYGKKALIIYLCWCLLRGLVFLLIGAKLLR